MRTRLATLLWIALLLASAGAAGAAVSEAVPTSFTYQGKLTTPEGKPVPDDRYALVFSLYPAQTGGTAFWTQETYAVTNRGVFSVELGPVTPSDLNRPEVWLELRVAGQDPLPRQKVNAVLYALRAGDLALPFSGTAAYANTAFSVDQKGTGSGGSFTVHNTSSSGYGLYTYTNGTGNALYAFSPGSGDTAVFQKSIGSGSAASFYAYGYSNQGSAVKAYSNGKGPVIQGTTDYTGAVAGFFKIDNTSSTQPALYATTTGTGSAIEAYTGNSATAVNAVSSGSGPGLKATGNYGGPAVLATATGTGYAADISSTNASSPNSVMRVSNASGSTANVMEVSHNGPNGIALRADTPNGAVAGYFHGGSSTGLPVLAVETDRSYTPALQVVSNGSSGPKAALFHGQVDMEGNLDVSGNVTAGANNVGMPIGYALFNTGGTRLRGTSNLTCTMPQGYTQYLVHIDGQTYTESSHIVLITPETTSGAVVAHCWPYNGDIRIEFRYQGSGDAAYCNFSILIY